VRVRKPPQYKVVYVRIDSVIYVGYVETVMLVLPELDVRIIGIAGDKPFEFEVSATTAFARIEKVSIHAVDETLPVARMRATFALDEKVKAQRIVVETEQARLAHLEFCLESAKKRYHESVGTRYTTKSVRG
jgi:hypothetical protein